MTSTDVPLLERLLDAARAEVAAQQTLTDAEGAYRRAWWTTSLMLADIPHGERAAILDAVANLLDCATSTLSERRNLAQRVAPEAVESESIYGIIPSHVRWFLVATGLPTIGPPEIVELQKLETEGWSIREIREGGRELRARLGLPGEAPTRAAPRSRPTVHGTGAQWAAIIRRAQRRRVDGFAYTRLADGALDVGLTYGGGVVDRFRLTIEGVIEGAT